MTLFVVCCRRSRLRGRGETGSRPLLRLQQADPARGEHDQDRPSRVRTGVHTADQRGEFIKQPRANLMKAKHAILVLIKSWEAFGVKVFNIAFLFLRQQGTF